MKIDWDDIMTGDPVRDAAIIRFVTNPNPLPCDKPVQHLDYWRKNGTDGVPNYKVKYGLGPFGGSSSQGDGGAFESPTRAEVMQRYDKEST